MAYKGKYKVKNEKKYLGDSTKVTFRSLWERQVMKWLDDHPDVDKWNSEEVVIPYLSETDNRVHRYFTDFFIRFQNGDTYIIEVKPDSQTKPPKEPKTGRRTRRYINESLTYVKNISKWKAATDYCSQRGWTFQVWTEKTLTSLGIKIAKK